VLSLNEKLRIGDWLLDAGAQTLSRAGESHRLNVKMLKLLWCLCEQPGQTVGREALIDAVWKGNRFVGQHGLTNVVWQLRQCLGQDAISTVAKVGYRLNLPITPVEAPRTLGKVSFLYSVPAAVAVLMVMAVAGWTATRETPLAPPAVRHFTQTSLTFFNGVE
jgi:DNA-binding winged helix-turn-helix (wHTH) protein